MKNYWLAALLLLASCEDKNLTSGVVHQGQAVQQQTVYPRNSVQVAVDQQLKAITAPIQQDISDIIGGELQSIDTNFNEKRITFQYQFWQIKKPSVCSHAQQNAMQFSDCTQATKQLFQSMCSQLQQAKQNPHPRTQQLQRMYCQAAVDFKPTVAQISRSQSTGDDKIQALRKNCNDLIFKAKISEDAKDEKARDKACNTYKQAANLD